MEIFKKVHLDFKKKFCKKNEGIVRKTEDEFRVKFVKDFRNLWKNFEGILRKILEIK